MSCAHSSETTCDLDQQRAYFAAVSEQTAVAAVEPRGVPSQGVPSVELPETSHDFGMISEDGDYVHHFRVKNTGTQVLLIKKVLPG